MKIPRKYSNLLFSFLISLLMSIVMSGLITLINTGADEAYLARWMNAFAIAWPIGLCCVVAFGKPTRRIVELLSE